MDGTGCRILVVDDHADTADLLSRILKREGWQVETAGSVAEAISKATAQPFDVLLCDLTLPDGDGCEVLTYLLSQPVGSLANPVGRRTAIAVTGHAYAQDLARSRLAGFAHHVVKPIDVKHLVRLVADHCTPNPS